MKGLNLDSACRSVKGPLVDALRHSLLLRMALLCAALWVVAPAYSQDATTPSMHLTTQERLETEAWWPTMASAPLKAYAGSGSCTACHTEQSSSTATGMQHAAMRPEAMRPEAMRPEDAHALLMNSHATFTSAGATYALTSKPPSLQLSVSNGHGKSVQNMDWIFGAGALAYTFLYNRDGRWFQSETSFYTNISALDITTGFGPNAALGNVLTPIEARSCFSCHTVHATTSAGFAPLHAEAGIGCEACHGPGLRHVTAMPSAKGKGVSAEAAIFNPGKLSPADSIDFCGSCHRSFADATLSNGQKADIAVVRFQPYRLEESKCWRATQDERLTCVACHDPHQPLNRDVASYDRNCLQCHSGVMKPASTAHTAAVCPKATHDCVTCHMPKVTLPSMHGDFTDHFIRIAKAGEPLPR
jgi:hypothetical protein